MVGLVAVAIHYRDIARRQQGLNNHLVRGGCSVGHKERMIGAERACRHFLRLFDISSRLEKAIEATSGRTALCQKKRRSVEFAHVANPIGFKNGFTTSNG